MPMGKRRPFSCISSSATYKIARLRAARNHASVKDPCYANPTQRYDGQMGWRCLAAWESDHRVISQLKRLVFAQLQVYHIPTA